MSARLAAAAAVLLILAPAASAAPSLHAHRGGTVVNGRALFAEESLPAYRHAARDGFVLEVDAKLTRDRVPVAIHDATLDRTTDCTGEVRSLTLAALRRCRPDVLGSPGSGLPVRRVSPRGRIATIAQVLGYARRAGAGVNLEIKNVPTDPDFDSTPAYANRVMDVVRRSGLPRRQLLIQSFIPDNLDVARRRLPGVATSLLSLNATADAFLDLAVTNRYRWISPEWPVSRDYVRRAPAERRLVAPYTLDRARQVRAAAGAGVDAIITDDPVGAAGALGLRPSDDLAWGFFVSNRRFQATGKLLRPRGVSRRAGCRGTVTVRVVNSRRVLGTRTVRLRRSCRFKAAGALSTATMNWAITIRFNGNRVLLQRLVGPRSLP
jgi:glycerophosphoryl diester phosphodiesterase